MKHTANETTTATLTRLIKAADRQYPVTLAYLKEEKDENGRKTGALVETVRTVEVYDFYVSAAGDIVIKAMDRQTSETRSFRVDRVLSYSIHRTRYLVARPVASDKPARTHGLASVTVLYPVDCPIARRIQILANALAA